MELSDERYNPKNTEVFDDMEGSIVDVGHTSGVLERT